MKPLPFALFALFALVAIARPAHAGDDADARAHFAAGLRAYDQAEVRHEAALYVRACEEFGQAYALRPSEHVLWNLALAEVDAGRYVEGYRHLELWRAHHPIADRDPKAKTFGVYLQRSTLATGHVAIVAPAGAAIFVDGADVGRAPVPPQVLEPGPVHHVDATIDGTLVRSTAHASAGETVTVTLEAPLAPPLPPAPRPELAPPPPRALAPRVLELPSPASAAPTFWTTRRQIGSATAGAGLVAFGVSILEAASARGAADRALSLRAGNASCSSSCSALERAYASENASAAASAAFAVAGVVLTAAGGALVLWPSASPTGVSIRGEF